MCEREKRGKIRGGGRGGRRRWKEGKKKGARKRYVRKDGGGSEDG